MERAGDDDRSAGAHPALGCIVAQRDKANQMQQDLEAAAVCRGLVDTVTQCVARMAALGGARADGMRAAMWSYACSQAVEMLAVSWLKWNSAETRPQWQARSRPVPCSGLTR
ncbi:hypothetical protein FVE85_0002 [Porphyridium purpureum]|uniref:Uncharacterized protein n=1 Tax=Porphyridium purpureum TaxID=35688 RepID=A0A5J4Z0B8_PORPP|nr:hypothetical protein FVE85_0002 [Porphyridium purpureum]|eukprot:POR9360..scf208_2